MSCERFDTRRHKRTGRVHLVEELGDVTMTVCGMWARRDHYRADGTLMVDRDHYRADGTLMVDADCDRCWNVIASRMPPRRRAETEVTAG